MSIKIRFYGFLKDILNKNVLKLENIEEINLKNLLILLTENYPNLKEFIKINENQIRTAGIIILINGRHVMFRGGLGAQIKKGDIIDFIPPIHGG